jgi:RNA polymerase sigma-70 factor (ECF subfamily)
MDSAGPPAWRGVVVSRELPAARPDAVDAGLVRQVAAGDRSAFSALYERHGQAVLAHIVLVVGERTLAEEILQDTMLALWNGAASFRGQSMVRSWLIAIARRKARDRMRRRRVHLVTDDILSGWPSSEPGPEDLTLRRDEAEAVADAIGELGVRHREILGLVYGASLTMADAADVLGVPLGTVKSRLAGARSALARSLSEKGYTQ